MALAQNSNTNPTILSQTFIDEFRNKKCFMVSKKGNAIILDLIPLSPHEYTVRKQLPSYFRAYASIITVIEYNGEDEECDSTLY